MFTFLLQGEYKIEETTEQSFSPPEVKWPGLLQLYTAGWLLEFSDWKGYLFFIVLLLSLAVVQISLILQEIFS